MSACVFSLFLDQSSLLTISRPERSNKPRAEITKQHYHTRSRAYRPSTSLPVRLCKVVAQTSVPSKSILAAAIPVGAAALHLILWTKQSRKTVVSTKLFPVPADAWTIMRNFGACSSKTARLMQS